MQVERRSIILSLTDEELFSLYQTIIDGDEKEALKFLNEYVKPKVQPIIRGQGICKGRLGRPGSD